MSDTYEVFYQVGGSANFEWRKTLRTYTPGNAEKMRESVERMGYPAIVMTTAELELNGPPTHFVRAV